MLGLVAVIAYHGAAPASAAERASTSDALYVDPDSLGGACSDERSPEAVSASAPWCSLDTALEAACDGATTRRPRCGAARVPTS